MGKYFTAILADGSERFAASMANNRADLFFDLAKTLERYVGKPCGIEVNPEDDEYRIDALRFIAFFEATHVGGWVTEPEGFVGGWASHAAGMIENITLSAQTWTCRDGTVLPVRRYIRTDELLSKKA